MHIYHQDPILGSISGLLNNRGTKVRLSFKNDTQELVVATSSSTTKIPYSSITKVEDQEIVGHEGYHILCIQLGSENQRLFLYWVPCQYVRALKSMLLGTWIL